MWQSQEHLVCGLLQGFDHPLSWTSPLGLLELRVTFSVWLADFRGKKQVNTLAWGYDLSTRGF